MKSGLTKVGAHCIFCGEGSKEPICNVIDHEYSTTDDVFTFVQCATCGLVFLDPRPASTELGTIYPENYFAFDFSKGSASRQVFSAKKISNFFEKRRLKGLLRNYSGDYPKSVLDVGCGDGSDLDLVRDLFGPLTATVGIEVSAQACSRAVKRGHTVIEGSFPEDIDQLADGGRKFDLILSKHVVEHVERPDLFLSAIRDLVADDGLVLIDTPNVSSPLRRLFGRHWGGWHTPRHWYLFDVENFSRLAESSGFIQVHAVHMPINMFWVWSLHSLLFDRYRRLADRLFSPERSGSGGLTEVILLSGFQVIEVAMKLLFRRTSQMRLLLRPVGTR